LQDVVTVEQVQGRDEAFGEFFLEFSHHFGRVETRWQARKDLRGRMAPIERRNGWSLAEHAGLDAGVVVQPVFRPGRGS
jgi:hypothetical protein